MIKRTATLIVACLATSGCASEAETSSTDSADITADSCRADRFAPAGADLALDTTTGKVWTHGASSAPSYVGQFCPDMGYRTPTVDDLKTLMGECVPNLDPTSSVNILTAGFVSASDGCVNFTTGATSPGACRETKGIAAYVLCLAPVRP